MTDRLSQLQDQVNYLATLFCDATGVLQAQARPSRFENFAESLNRAAAAGHTDAADKADAESEAAAAAAATASVEEIKANFAELITSTAKRIDAIIDSLPDEDESNEQLLAQQLRQLETENTAAARQLELVTNSAEHLLKQIQDKIAQIAAAQLSIQQPSELLQQQTKSLASPSSDSKRRSDDDDDDAFEGRSATVASDE